MRLVEFTYIKDPRAEQNNDKEHGRALVYVHPEQVTHVMPCELREYPAGSTTIVTTDGTHLIVVHPMMDVVQRLARTWGK